MCLLTIGNNKEKCAPLLEWIAGGGNLGGRIRKEGTSRGSYVLLVGCGVGLCWNVGEACRRLLHMCSS